MRHVPTLTNLLLSSTPADLYASLSKSRQDLANHCMA